MDPPQEFYGQQSYSAPVQRGQRSRRGMGGQQNTHFQPQPSGMYNSNELFEDMSTYNTPTMMSPTMNHQQQPQQQQPMTHQQQTQPQFPGQNLMNDPMASMAMQYGSAFVPAGKEFVEKKIDHFLSVSKVKYYFAVDTTYVLKKLGLLVFPFAHQDWSLKYDNTEPVAPRFEINAPDLYIPSMAFVTYVLVCSVILGTQDRFTPDELGMTASSALVWLFIELIVIIGSMYIVGIASQVRYLDLLAFCGYKYVGMILSSVSGLLFKSMGYYGMLLWTSFTMSFFLARTLRVIIHPDSSNSDSMSTSGNKRRLYILLFIALIQPLSMYFLTRHLMNYTPELLESTINEGGFPEHFNTDD